MQLERIKIFAEIVNEGSFTKAAESLGVSKAFLSKQMKELEAQLGTQLLIRNTRSMRLTANGETLLQHGNSLRTFWEDAKRSLKTADQSLSGLVSFTAPSALAKYKIMPQLDAFLAQYPDIQLHVQTSNEAHNLVDTTFDFALRITNAPPQDMVASELFSFDYVTCATKEYLEQHGTVLVPEDLEKHKRLVLSYWQKWRYINKEGKHQGSVDCVKSAAHRAFTDNELIKQSMLANSGVARLPRYMLEHELKTGQIKSLMNTYTSEERRVYLIYPQTITRSARVEKVIKRIKEMV